MALDAGKEKLLYNLADKLRVLSVLSTSDNPAGNSGHPTTCSSCAELMSVLFYHQMRYDRVNRRDPSSDRFVLSKGHAAPILFAAWVVLEDFQAGGGQLNLKELGPSQTELVNHLRETGHKYEGHPTPKLDFVDVATGSLGQGLSCAAGMAYAGKFFDKASYQTYCLLGDGETAEGSVYEAMAFAGFYKLDNLVALVDLNRLGQSQATMYQHDAQLVAKRWESFDWEAIVVDGHNVAEVVKALAKPSSGKPRVLVCVTFKGKGFEGVENLDNWHGKPLSDPKKFVKALVDKLPSEPVKLSALALPEVVKDAPSVNISNLSIAKSAIPAGTTKLSTRKAYGISLAALNNDRVVALDGDVKNSTFAIDYMKARPNQFVECYIAEQNLVGVAMGVACRDRTVAFASTFAAFLSRAYDHIRMGAISLTNANFVGSHCGVSIGADGPSQMALEDLAMFRAIPTATIFYPSDAISMERAVELAANTKGICYIRTTRDDTPLLYEGFTEPFAVGKSRVIRQSSSDKAVVIGAGITLYEALKAYDQLKSENILIRVIDVFCLKPLDKATILESARQSGGLVVTVEDHYPEGGIGEAVSSALSEEQGITVSKLAVNGIPYSGKRDDLLDQFNINSRAIVAKVKQLLAR